MEHLELVERELLEQCSQVATLVEYLAWLQRCDECIKQLEEPSSSPVRCHPRFTVGNGQSVVARVERLAGAKIQLKKRFVYVDGEYASASRDNSSFVWREIDTAFESRVLTGAVEYVNVDYIEPRRFLEDAGGTVLERVRDAVKRHGSVKVNTALNGEFATGGAKKRADKSINTENIELFRVSNVDEWYERHVVEPTLASLEEERDGGWALSRILNLTVNADKYIPSHARCNFEVPREIASRRAVINVRSLDNACFAWSVVAALHPAEGHTDRESSYPHYASVLNLQGIIFPVTLNQIKRFEHLNDVSVNVYGIEGRKILPLLLTNRKMEKHVNLLYAQDPRDDNSAGHFACIKDLPGLVSSQLKKYGHKRYLCDRCLRFFSSSKKLQSHTMDCERMNDYAIRLPSENDKWLEFKNHTNKERLPFVVYADLESVLRRTESGEKEDGSSYAYQQHEVFSVGYYARCSYDDALSVYRFRRGEDCVAWFVRQLERLAHRVKSLLSATVPAEMLSREQWEAHRGATRCHICEKPFAPDDTRVRDHCHLTGRYRGPSHSNCDLNYKDSYCIPVVFHNLSGYDAHFLIAEVATAFEGGIDVLPITKEKYISFTKHVRDRSAEERTDSRNVRLRFIDSYKFLSTSLEKLASLLTRDKLKILRSEFSTLSNEKFDLLTRKGVFPYEYVDRVDKLQDTRLPARESFYSSWTGDTVSENDYAHAVNVWRRFSIETLGEYSDLYLKTDVLLLADVFENFRESCAESYNLDPARYYTLPGFAWDAMLKYTGVKLELLTDVDMVMFIERGIRGGLGQCSGRYARANNRYARSYDPSRPSSYLMYYSVNNLYGWAMRQPLPYAEFRWVRDVASFDVSAIAPDSPTGYILEVDLEYPRHLHDRHADLPFCPARDKPPGGTRQDKLLATLRDKRRYVIHYRNLQQCTRHGLRIAKIHRVLQFAQSAWLRDYVERNAQLGACARNDFEKNLYERMNSAIYGKTIENVRNYVDVRLATKWDGRSGAGAMIARPNFRSRTVYAENLIAVELRKLEVKFNRPIYVGMCMLDVSKVRLYEFHHEYMSPLYRDKCKIMHVDTDSLVYHIECDDVYETMKRDIGKFDTSDYPTENAYGMPLANRNVPGLMRDENNGAIMTEFVGLGTRMYAIRVDGKEDTKKAKGVKSNVVARTITFDDYMRCLNEEIEMTRRQSYVRSKLHQVYTVSESRIVLSPYDDKRYVVPNSTETLPWGHWRIPL